MSWFSHFTYYDDDMRKLKELEACERKVALRAQIEAKVAAVNAAHQERQVALRGELHKNLGSLPADIASRYIELRMNYENTSVGENHLEMQDIYLQLFARIFEKLDLLQK